MTHKIVVAALFVVFAHSTLAHEVDCEKQVGILRTDAGGQVVLAEDGSPVFAAAPETILRVDSYPVTVGWQLKVNNLAGEPSTVRNVEDPFLGAWGATLFGAPAAPFELAVGQTKTFTAGLRIESYEQCRALGGEPAPTFASGEGCSGKCQGVTENRLVVTTDTNIAECRARLVCRPQKSCSAPQWMGVREYFGPEGSPSTIDIGYGVAVSCQGETHFVGEASYLATPGSPFALLGRLSQTGAVVEERTWAPGGSPRNTAWSVALDRSGRRVVVGGYIGDGFLRVVEPDGTVVWEETAPRVTHGGGSFIDAEPDAEGNVYAALVVRAPNPPPPGGTDSHDVFVRKYTPAGALVWETILSSVHQDDVSALAVTPLGDVFVTGFTLGDLIPGAPPDGYKRFVARLGPDGAVRWVKQAPLSGAFHGLAVDALGSLAITGESSVAALDQDGNVRWVRPIQTAKPPGAGTGVAIDSTGAIWVVGATDQVYTDPKGRYDAFVARYDAAGNLLWVRQLGGDYPVMDNFTDIVVDAAGYGVAVGSAASPDPVHGGILRSNVVLLRIAPDGTY